MNDGEPSVDRWRRAARELHRALGAPDAAVARAAAVRLAALPRFARHDLADLVGGRGTVDRRDAEEVVALEAGFAGWAQLLAQMLPDLQRVTMFVDGMSTRLNRWFTSHDDAAESRRRQGGILLPYRSQFVVVELAAVADLGLDPADPDWRRIGFDWARPLDAEAQLRLARARWHAMLARGEALP